MSEIREKIMATEPTFHDSMANRYNRHYYTGYILARKAAADIAEAEVQRLEAIARELESLRLKAISDTVVAEKRCDAISAAARRLVEAVRWRDDVDYIEDTWANGRTIFSRSASREIFETSVASSAFKDAALSEVEALLNGVDVGE